MRTWQKEAKACQEAMESCLENLKAKPENTKASLEETEAVVDVFKENLDKMDTIMEWKEVCNEEMNVDTIGAVEDLYGD